MLNDLAAEAYEICEKWLAKWKPLLGEANPLSLQMQGMLGELMLALHMDTHQATLLLRKAALENDKARKALEVVAQSYKIQL